MKSGDDDGSDLFDPHETQVLKGDNDRYVRKDEVAKIFADLLRSGTYQSGQIDGQLNRDGFLEYFENSVYWEQARTRHFFHGQRLCLRDFWITEWAPFSPGQYFTTEAEENRRHARRYFNDDSSEYLPLGKNYMILGGIGSLRFSARSVGSANIFVLGASSSGVSHEGVPITCEEEIYRRLSQDLKEAGGVKCDLYGHIRHLPNEVAKLKFSRNVEKYCVHVSDVVVKRPAAQRDLLCTAQILFPSHYSTYRDDDSDEYFEGDGYKTRLVKSWSFASFRPGQERSPGSVHLDDAVSFLQSYVERYGGDCAPILNDFDEMQDHFYNPVEFPLSAIKEGDIDVSRLDAYQKYLGSVVYVGKMSVRIGDTFRDISGSTIVNRSKVKVQSTRQGKQAKEKQDAKKRNAKKAKKQKSKKAKKKSKARKA
jgi:hypothetical protein